MADSLPQMDFVTLGRTRLKVSVLGLGAGGHSRLGQQTGRSEDESADIVRRALDLGISFIDTAEAYRTEPIVGQAIRGRRHEVVLSTKKTIREQGHLITPRQLATGLEDSLRRLDTDRIEIYHLHGVPASHYPEARDQLVPAMLRLREQGKIRFLGITEAFGSDTGHEMLSLAGRDNCWDVMMVGFNILNQSARQRVLPATQQKQIGVLDMFAVRSALSRPDKLREVMSQLMQSGLVDADDVDLQDPLGFIKQDGAAEGIVDAAYRFCRQEPGVHVVLSGTGSIDHLEQNVRSILGPPLPEALRQRLIRMFERVDTVSGQ
jgi:aryl-alcohol dehydrogenase-like predicted oxidoreductase